MRSTVTRIAFAGRGGGGGLKELQKVFAILDV